MNHNTFIVLENIGIVFTILCLVTCIYLLMADAGLIGTEFTEWVEIVECDYDDDGVYCKVQNESFHEVIRDSDFYDEYHDKIGENTKVVFNHATFFGSDIIRYCGVTE